MSDWDEEEAKYMADSAKYLENIEKQLDLQRESQKSQVENKIKWTRPKIGVRRNYYQRFQRGFHQTFPPKAAKRLFGPGQ